MSSLETRKIEPATGTTVTLGAGGDTVLVSADQLKTNTVKDAGGNTLFTSDGAGTLSSVNSAIAGSMTFISSQTATAATSIEFTTQLTSAYNEYVFFFVKSSLLHQVSSFSFLLPVAFERIVFLRLAFFYLFCYLCYDPALCSSFLLKPSLFFSISA